MKTLDLGSKRRRPRIDFGFERSGLYMVMKKPSEPPNKKKKTCQTHWDERKNET